jgi:hypothetical protein
VSFDGGQSSVSTPSFISVTPYSVVLGFSVSIRFRSHLILSHKSTINSIETFVLSQPNVSGG